MQTAVPTISGGGNYTPAAPFLVFIPSAEWESGEQGGQTFVRWNYDVTAHPKMGYTPPYIPPAGGSFTVVKAWNDVGFESARPGSIAVTLYRDGAAYSAPGISNPVTLSAGNDWRHTWTNLPEGGAWSVDETGVPGGYFSTSTTMGNITTITNTHEELPPLAAAVNVRKVWADDTESARPDSIQVTLYRDGAAYDTVSLTAEDDWMHSWVGLEDGHVWNVAEEAVPAGYEAAVVPLPNGFEITNTWRGTTPPTDGDEGTDLGEDPTPLNPAPQTGMVQWPIPVLAVSGALLIALGLFTGRRRKRTAKG